MPTVIVLQLVMEQLWRKSNHTSLWILLCDSNISAKNNSKIQLKQPHENKNQKNKMGINCKLVFTNV